MTGNWISRHPLIAIMGVIVVAVALVVWWQFRADIEAARNRIATGSIVRQTPCGAIEYGTYASAEYTAAGIVGAQFTGFDTGGHVWLGHNDAVMNAIADLILAPEQTAER